MNYSSLIKEFIWSYKWPRFLHRHCCNREEGMLPQISQTYTHTYMLLYTNTYIIMDKIITSKILVYIMCYTCKLYTVYLRVLKIYSINRLSEHPWNFFPIFPWFINPFPNRHQKFTCFSNKLSISPTCESNHLSNFTQYSPSRSSNTVVTLLKAA